MVHLDEVTVPASGRIVFKPGDYHLMLVQPTCKLQVRGKISVTREFGNGEKVTPNSKCVDLPDAIPATDVRSLPRVPPAEAIDAGASADKPPE